MPCIDRSFLLLCLPWLLVPVFPSRGQQLWGFAGHLKVQRLVYIREALEFAQYHSEALSLLQEDPTSG